MTRALSDAELDGLDRAAAVGFHRDAPDVPDELRREGEDAPGLTLAAFAAHQRRLTTLPPRTPATVERFTAPPDPRPPMPEPLRANLRLVVSAIRRNRADALLIPIGWALRDRGWRLHPFDTDLLAPLRAAAGPYERWLAELSAVDLGDEGATADVDDAQWAALPPAQRAAWLRRRRFVDPDAARALLVAAWAAEKADVRQRLLPALEVRLGPGDAEFLASLTTDRSGPVRELGARLLMRVGSELSEAAFPALVASSVKVARVAFVGPKRVSLLPGVDKARLFDAIAARPLGDVLAAMGVDIDIVLASGGEVVALYPAFSLAALRAGNPALFDRLGRLAIDAGANPGEGAWRERLMELPREARRPLLLPWAEGPLTPTIAASLAKTDAWIELFGGPLGARGAAALRRTASWKELLGKLRDGTEPAEELAVRAVAPLIPGGDARAAAAELAAVGTHAAPLVRLTWTLLADLEGAP